MSGRAAAMRRSRSRAAAVRFTARRRGAALAIAPRRHATTALRGVARRRATATAAAALACGALAACSFSRPTPETRYYTLTVPGAPSTHLDSAVKVGVFTADQPYAAERFAYRSSPYLLEYYTYHRWAGNPRVLVASAIRDYLDHAAGDGTPPLEIQGHIRRLEEVDAPEQWSAALALDLSVARGGVVLFQKSYAETEPAEKRNPEAVAAALSRALGRIVDQMLRDVPATTAPATQPPRARRSEAR
jgi:hypothetical protein